MPEKYQYYTYYAGEGANPFEAQKVAHAFWGFEMNFEKKFEEADFSIENWEDPNSSTEEWQRALNPLSKEELFKLSKFGFLAHLSDKHQTPYERLLELYKKKDY